MNETRNDAGTDAGTATGHDPGQAPQPQLHHDLDKLRRSTTNRYIAGVAGGLGRHFNIDPTVIRVLLVVLSFFGGAGLVIYAVCWLFVPEDNAAHAPIRIGSEPRKILLLAAAGIAFLLAVGDAFNGFNAGWPIVSIAVLIAVVLIIRDRGRDDAGTPAATVAPPATPPGTPPATPPATPPGTPPTTWAGAAYSDPAYSSGTEPTAVLDPATAGYAAQPPAWQPPQPPQVRPPLVPPRPKRTGVLWFWPTLALIAVGLGVLGIYDNSHHVVDGAYPALALGITAVMLLVGSFFGRPGGLILIGFLASIALAGNVAVGGRFGVDAKEIHESPTTAAQVQDEYRTTVGEIRLDLSKVSDPQALAGRTLDVHLRTGNIVITVPRNLNVHVDAAMGIAGGISVPGNDGGGFNHAVDTTLVGVPATTSAPLELDVHAKLGQITVEYR